MEVLEKCNVSPPPNSIPTTTIPLTFFDVPWLLCSPVERILFYEFSHSTIYFTHTILPQLKHALSLTLQHYFSLAGSIVYTNFDTPPYILYQIGDSIPLTIAESKNNFGHLSNYCLKEVKEFRSLVPHLSNEIISISTSETDDQVTSSPVQLIRPLVALQVTVFPESGISISFAYRHMVDGRSINQFITSWASIFKTKNTISLEIQPYYDRSTIIKDPNGLLQILWKQWCDAGVSWENFANSSMVSFQLDKLHATFVINRVGIDKLRQLITSNVGLQPLPLPYISTFVIASAFIWACLIKTINVGAQSEDDGVLEYLGFPADCTGSKNENDFYVPKTYFGNCLIFCTASVRKHELLGENGFFTAIKAIMTAIKERDCGFLHGIDTWITRVGKLVTSNHIISVAGSPKLRVYETDFGWGRPKKSDIVHIDGNSIWQSISFMESRDDEGGVEAGIALSKADMKIFTSIFEQGLYNQ